MDSTSPLYQLIRHRSVNRLTMDGGALVSMDSMGHQVTRDPGTLNLPRLAVYRAFVSNPRPE